MKTMNPYRYGLTAHNSVPSLLSVGFAHETLRQLAEILRKSLVNPLDVAGRASRVRGHLAPLFTDTMPRNVFAILSMLAVSGAFISRLVAQKGV